MAANDVPCCETMFWVYVFVSVALVVFAGLMSGLTLGLMSLSLLDLEVLIKAGQPNDRKNAEKILPIVKNQHLLLCTLLICNSLAMEALPIFLDSVLLPWCAILISVTLVLAFGEIIPQAVCSRYGLAVGAKLAVFVRLLVIVVFPIAYPLSKLLDIILGKGHSVLLRRAELKTLVDLHGNKAGKGGELTNDETTIITGALDLAQKTVKDVMTPLSEIFSLELNSKLNNEAMSLLLSKGHSRVPIYLGRPENIIGLILVKNLIKCRPEDETPLRNLSIRKIPRIHDSLPLYEMLNLFQKGHSHMAVVVKTKNNSKDATEHATPKNNAVKIDMNVNSTETKLEEEEGGLEGQYSKYGKIYRYASSISADDTKPPISALDQNISNDIQESASKTDKEIIGLITMEDVLEELLQEPILDETDEYVDVHNIIQINMLPRVGTSLMRSPGAALASHPNWQTVVASPLSSSASRSPLSPYHHSPMLGSPHLPFIRSPFVKPTLYGSPGKAMPNSPASPVSSSPSSHRVSRKSYEKLKRPGDL